MMATPTGDRAVAMTAHEDRGPTIFRAFAAARKTPGLLILAKGDEQIVHILEGKLFCQEKDLEQAVAIYRKHKR
ncbi:hypothetical protein HNP60_002573 [Sphingobium sp. B1D3A]|uniref:Uncharacterized protein n=1 Tax=Sphingobium lignivorans TaxID=2735886 RepID=A0ABR6NH32_9SPHN|nr:hypothetical protein [Sphingobium lignivorans]